MKKLFFTLLATVLLNGLTAQAQKIAHINLDSLINMMPEYVDALKAADDHLKLLQAEAMTMQNELSAKYNAYLAAADTLPKSIKKKRESELQELDSRIQQFQMDAQQEFTNKQQQLAQPIYEKAKSVIEVVAKEKGYKYVMDSSLGLIIVSDPADDLFDAVKKKLGISGVPAPAATAPQK